MRAARFALAIIACAVVLTAGGVQASNGLAPSPEIPFTTDTANQPVLQPQTADPALAELATAPVETEHAKKAGLPQFDPSTYSKQIFWLFVTFLIMYTVFSRSVLPNLSAGMKKRAATVQEMVVTAARMRDEAESLKLQYEAALDKAKADSKAILTQMQEDQRRQQEKQDADFNAKARAAIEALETRLETSKTNITADLKTLGAGLAQDIAQKTAGVAVDEKKLQTIAGTMVQNTQTLAKAA